MEVSSDMKEKRKKRKDAKVDYKPTVPIPLKTSIERLSVITGIVVKDVADHLVVSALNSVEVISYISKCFQRDLRFNNTLFFGNTENPTVTKRHPPGTTDRVSLRVSQNTDHLIGSIAYALRCTPHTACAALLEQAMLNYDIVNDFIRNYLVNGLDEDRLNELQKVMNYINSMDNTFEYSWADLLSLIAREVNAPITSPNEMVDEFIINNWRDNR
ncbi:hypothetical protein KQ41_07095 [Lysinibacillus fusiformis]|nr:hypothetical protein KQ41_07095 [Lysinibacillus fusiformis]